MSRLKLFDGILLNSACPWAFSLTALNTLLENEYTCAVTTQTTSYHAFEHDSTIRNHIFVDEKGNTVSEEKPKGKTISSLNTYGYSSMEYSYFWAFYRTIDRHRPKLWIFSIDYITMDNILEEFVGFRDRWDEKYRKTFFEVNLSCPNLQGKPPPGYDMVQIHEILPRLQRWLNEGLNFGLKLPPYRSKKEIQDVVATLEKFNEDQPIKFLTATNTFGGCQYLKPGQENQICGLGGSAIHALAVQNVSMLNEALRSSSCRSVRKIVIIGVGGVKDGLGVKRMLDAGASHVALATALGFHGIDVFEKIAKEYESITRGEKIKAKDENVKFGKLYERLGLDKEAMTMKE